MKIVQAVPSISLESSGPSYSVSRLSQALIDRGVEVTLAAVDFGHESRPPDFAKTFPVGLGPKKLGRSPAMLHWFRKEMRLGNIELVHGHGMWQMNAIYPATAAHQFNVPFVVSPRGALSIWAMAYGSKFKNLFWRLLQRSALEKATCFHATATAEMDDIRRLGFKQPVAVIPNGIDVGELLAPIEQPLRTLLFLGRIHPVKGLEFLLSAWRKVQDRHPQWQLSIVGSDVGYDGGSGYLEEMRAFGNQLGVERVNFVGEKHGEDKQRAYADAELFVLPSHSENFGVAVAESLAAGTPAIVSKGAPWEGLNTNGAGWHIDIGVEPLVSCLEQALSCEPEQLRRMGHAGRDWMRREYSWDSVGERMYETYRWLCGERSQQPDWVFTLDTKESFT